MLAISGTMPRTQVNAVLAGSASCRDNHPSQPDARNAARGAEPGDFANPLAHGCRAINSALTRDDAVGGPNAVLEPSVTREHLESGLQARVEESAEPKS